MELSHILEETQKIYLVEVEGEFYKITVRNHYLRDGWELLSMRTKQSDKEVTNDWKREKLMQWFSQADLDRDPIFTDCGGDESFGKYSEGELSTVDGQLFTWWGTFNRYRMIKFEKNMYVFTLCGSCPEIKFLMGRGINYGLPNTEILLKRVDELRNKLFKARSSELPYILWEARKVYIVEYVRKVYTLTCEKHHTPRGTMGWALLSRRTKDDGKEVTNEFVKERLLRWWKNEISYGKSIKMDLHFKDHRGKWFKGDLSTADGIVFTWRSYPSGAIIVYTINDPSSDYIVVNKLRSMDAGLSWPNNELLMKSAIELRAKLKVH